MSARRLARSLATLVLSLGTGLGAAAAAEHEVPLVSLGSGVDGADVTVLVFDAVIVPGDLVVRDFEVRNDGPSDARLTIDIVDVELTGEVDEFFDDLTLNGTSFAVLDSGPTRVLETDLARGEVAPVSFAVDFPWQATSGNRSQVGERSAAFQMRLTLTGDLPTGTPGPDPSPRPGARGGSGATLPSTGASIVPTLGAAVLLGAAGLGARWLHRRMTADHTAGETS